ncbi:simple sugar transport system permease protein/ribose transport system permease protein [Streptosporangium album]|uniref:Simple sugar transport system permease protein/ribose transport system permease protein n=1 Tax=Streptosporangium album TaxID=47479 RepID=A0A7W7W7E4_9ACTN|nr:ABC transporter permease [Streptosporangium album]MBB4937227.1 simple sugar transport system permease protein/ribose transport system permease protein [Streptosporangium album]
MTTTKTSPAVAVPAGRRIQLGRFRDLTLVPVIVVLLIAGSFVDPVFLTPGNLINVLQQQSALALVVLAEALILIAGKFDLSLESTVGMAPAVGVMLVIPVASGGFGLELPAVLAIPLCLLIGGLIGAFNGFLIMRFQLSAFIVTLAMMIVVHGLQLGLTQGKSLFALPESFLYLGSATWLGVPAAIWITGVLFAGAIAALGYFRAGRALYAIGGNADAARAAGIRVERVLWTVFVVGGVIAALAGVLETGRLGGISANQGVGWIFMAFAAAVIGGVSMDGGKGTILGALTGVLVIGLVENILTLKGVPGEWKQLVYGSIILIALMISRLAGGKAQD